MNLPNSLTVARMALVPVFIIFFYLGQGGALAFCGLAFVVFVVASATDAIDGYIARRDNLITNFGKLMDPLADKVLTASAFIVFVDMHIIPAWMVIVVLVREFAVTGLRGVAASEGEVIPAGFSGKLKTVFQMVAISLILLGSALYGGSAAYAGHSYQIYSFPPVWEPSQHLWGFVSQFQALPSVGPWLLWIIVFGAGFICLWAAVALTVYSGIEYFWKGRKLLKAR